MSKAVLLFVLLVAGVYCDCNWGNASFQNPSYCSECEGEFPTECTECMNSSDFYLTEGNCCPYNYFLNESGECQICHSNCLACTGPSQYECIGCQPEQAFVNNCGPGECVPAASFQGTYNYIDQYPEKHCAQGYTQAGPNGNICLEDPNFEGSTCAYDECFEGYIFNYVEERCELCGYQFEGMSEASQYENACYECSNRNHPDGEIPEHPEDVIQGCDCCMNDYIPMGPVGTCCPFNYIYDESVDGQCTTCHPTCAQCQAYTEFDCVACHPGNMFKDGISPGECVHDADYETPEDGVDQFVCAEGYTLYKNYFCLRNDLTYVEDLAWNGNEITTGVCDWSYSGAVWGCTDPEAENYNPEATEDDGSCISEYIYGCTDASAVNYNPDANVDDGSCDFNQCSDADRDCEFITFCRGCNFTGDRLIVDENQDCMDWSPESVCVPRGKQVRVYDACMYEGQTATFTEGNVECIEQIEFEMLAQHGITLSGKKSGNLKTNSRPQKIRFEVL